MLIVPPDELCGHTVNGWGVEFSDWKGFFSSDKEGGTNVKFNVLDKEIAGNNISLKANVKLPDLYVELTYKEKRTISTINRSVKLRVLQDGILGDLVLRLRLQDCENPTILQSNLKIDDKITFDRNFFLEPKFMTEIKSQNGLSLELSDSTKKYRNLGLHRYVRAESDGLRIHSRLIGSEFYMHSFAPHFLFPMKFKVKKVPLLSDKNILVRERFRNNFIQKKWQKVPALRVKKNEIYQLNQKIIIHDL